jgi:pimeloyl-ACP methyl ester carboxylesterase
MFRAFLGYDLSHKQGTPIALWQGNKFVLAKRNKPKPKQPQFIEKSVNLAAFPRVVESSTGRHTLDVLYERFSKPQFELIFKKDEPSIYLRHTEGQILQGNYQVEKVFEDQKTGFYAEGRIPLSKNLPPVLVIRGYGSWYPFDGVLQDTPEVFIAHLDGQSKAAETQGVVDWMINKCEQGDRPDVIGESLGGKIAQQLAVNYPHLIRSVVTFNPLGISPDLAQSSPHPSVFHYFTLGERYAFWANQGEFIPGKIFQISKRGTHSWKYQLTEWLIQQTPSPLESFKSRHCALRILEIIQRLGVQILLIYRHNGLIFTHPNPVVQVVELTELIPDPSTLLHARK